MTEKPADQDHADPSAPTALMVEPAFVLLFSIHLKGGFKGFGSLPTGITPLPPEQSNAYITQLSEFETRLLGKTFCESERLARTPLGRVALNSLPKHAPAHADVYLLTHQSGVALWEVWLPAPSQPFDTVRWIGWLDPENDDGLVARLWHVLGPVNQQVADKPAWSGLYFPLTLLRAPEVPLDTLVERHGTDLIHLLFLDHSSRPFKPGLVAEELGRDYCAREGGMTLLSRRSGLDVHGREDAGEERSSATVLPPRSALPFLITIELLLIEQAVLAHLYQRLSRRMPGSVEELLTLQQEVLDALEEYYGAITNATRFSDAVTADGERLLGLGDLYDAVHDRLDTVSFAITTRYQKRMTLMQFWLTVVFGATEIGFIASGIATWYYQQALGTVLAWTLGASVVTGLVLVLLLRGKVE